MIVVSMIITILAAALTVPAGFGLATMLTPVVLLWLPPHEAVAAVAIIHGAHNAWKLKLLKSRVDFSAVKRYGWALVIGAIIGALLHSHIPSDPLLLVVGVASLMKLIPIFLAGRQNSSSSSGGKSTMINPSTPDFFDCSRNLLTPIE